MSRMMKWTMVSMLSLASLGTAAKADEPNKGAQVRQQLHDYGVQQVITELNLDAASQAKFRAVDAKYEPRISQAREQVREAMKALKAQENSANAATLRQLTDNVLSAKTNVEAITEQRREDLRQALTPQQFAQLIVAWPKINRRIHGKVWKSMHGGAAAPAGE